MPPASRPESELLRALLQRFIRDFGLLSQSETPCGRPIATSQAHALMALLDRSEPLSQGELARELGIDKSNVTRLCRRMEQEGHLERLPSETDARVRYLRLTARGVKLAREVERASAQRFSALLDAVPVRERPRLLKGLEVLSKAVREVRDEG